MAISEASPTPTANPLKPTEVPTSAWVLRSQVPAGPSDVMCKGRFRSALLDPEVVLARGTWLELLTVNQDGQAHSVCCQQVYGTPIDMKALPVDTGDVPFQDLLLLLSDSGNLSVLAFSSELNRFVAIQQVTLDMPGHPPQAAGRIITVAPSHAVAVAACTDHMLLFQVHERGDRLCNLIAAAMTGIVYPRSSDDVPTQVTVLEPEPVRYSSAGGRLAATYMPPGTSSVSTVDADNELADGRSAATTGSAGETVVVDSLMEPADTADMRDTIAQGLEWQSDANTILSGAASHTFTIWDVAFLGHDTTDRHVSGNAADQQHAVEGGTSSLHKQQPKHDQWDLVCLTHRPDISSTDLTALRWVPAQRLVFQMSRLTLPHSTPLGIPTHVRHVPGTASGVVLLGTRSVLLLDCQPMRAAAQLMFDTPYVPPCLHFHRLGPYAQAMATSTSELLHGIPPSTNRRNTAAGMFVIRHNPIYSEMGARHAEEDSSASTPMATDQETHDHTRSSAGSIGRHSVAFRHKAAYTGSRQTLPVVSDTGLSTFGTLANLAARQAPHTAVCATWLEPCLMSVGLVQTLLVCTSSGRHMCLHVHQASTAPAADDKAHLNSSSAPTLPRSPQPGTNPQHRGFVMPISYQHGKYLSMLPSTQLYVNCTAVTWATPPIPTAASSVLGLHAGLLLYKPGIGNLLVTRVQPLAAALKNIAQQQHQHCPAVSVQQSLRPEAEWASQHFTAQLRNSHTCCLWLRNPISMVSELGCVQECTASHVASIPALYTISQTITGGGVVPSAHTVQSLGSIATKLNAVQIHQPTTVLAAGQPGSFVAATGMWAVPATVISLHDCVLVVSFLAATRVLLAGSEMSDVTDLLGVSSCESTVTAGLVMDGVMAQVTPSAVLLLPLESVTNGADSSDKHTESVQGSEVVGEGSDLHGSFTRVRAGAGGFHAKLSRIDTPTNTPVAKSRAYSPPPSYASMLKQNLGPTMGATSEHGRPESQGHTQAAMQVTASYPAAPASPVPTRVYPSDVGLADDASGPIRVSPLHSALRRLAVSSGTEDNAVTECETYDQDAMECTSSRRTDNAQIGTHANAGTYTAAAEVMSTPGPYDSSEDPCIWRPSGSDQRATSPILTAAVATGCVVVHRAGTTVLEVLSVFCRSNRPMSGSLQLGGHGHRKRQRPACALQEAATIPCQHEVSCMLLQPWPSVSTPSVATTNKQEYILLVGHRGPGVTLFRLVITPRGVVTHQPLSEAMPPPLYSLDVTQQGLGTVSLIPHSLAIHTFTTSQPGQTAGEHQPWATPGLNIDLPLPQQQAMHTAGTHMATHQGTASIAEPMDTREGVYPLVIPPADMAMSDAPDTAKSEITDTGFGRQTSKGSHVGKTSAAADAIDVVIQWLVGFRQGSLALYQWRGAAGNMPTNSAGVSTAAQLLWMVSLGSTPLTLTVMTSRSEAQPAALQQPSQTALSHSQTGGMARQACRHGRSCWPSVFVVGDSSWVVSVSPISDRIMYKHLAIQGTPAVLASAIHMPGLRPANTNTANSRSSKQQLQNDSAPCLLITHSDATWEMVTVETASKIELSNQQSAAEQAQPAALPAAWISPAVPTASSNGLASGLLGCADSPSAAWLAAQQMIASDAAGRSNAGLNNTDAGGSPGAKSSNAPASYVRRTTQPGSITGSPVQPASGSSDIPSHHMPLPEHWTVLQVLSHTSTDSVVLLCSHRRPGQPLDPYYSFVTSDCKDGGVTSVQNCSDIDTSATATLWTALGLVSKEPMQSPWKSSQGQEQVLGSPDGRFRQQASTRGHGSVLQLVKSMMSPTQSLQQPGEGTSSSPAGFASTPASPTTLQMPRFEQVVVVGTGVSDPGQVEQRGAVRVYRLLYHGHHKKRSYGTSQLPSTSQQPFPNQASTSEQRMSASEQAGGDVMASSLKPEAPGLVPSITWHEEAALKLPDRVHALCGVSPTCLAASVGRRLVTLTLKKGHLAKTGWLPTRNPITMMAACGVTKLLATSDGSTGVTLYMCDPGSIVIRSVLQVLAADILPRCVTALYILPDEPLFSNESSNNNNRVPGGSQSMSGGQTPIGSPSPIGSPVHVARREAYQHMPTMRYSSAGSIAATDSSSSKENSSVGLLPGLDTHTAYINRIIQQPPATIVVSDISGCITLLRAEAQSLSPVRNLVQTGMMYLNDNCIKILRSPWESWAATPFSRHEGLLEYTQSSLQQQHRSHQAAYAKTTDTPTRPLLLSATSGSLYSLRHVGRGHVALLLHKLQETVSQLAVSAPVTGAVHTKYRGTCMLDDLATYTAPEQRSIIDGDVLEQYLDMPWHLKCVVVASMMESSKGVCELLQRVSSEMRKICGACTNAAELCNSSHVETAVYVLIDLAQQALNESC